MVDDHRDILRVAAGGPRFGRIEGRAALRRLANGDEPLARHHQVDLLVEDGVLLGDGDGDEEDAEDVVAVGFELRPRLVLMLSRRAELLHRPVVDIRRQNLLELVPRRLEQVDPLLADHSERE